MRETKFKQTDIGLIPEDWEVKHVGQLVRIGNGRDYKHLKPGNIPVYGTGGYMTSVSDFLYDGETVCIGRKGTIDKPFYHSGKIWTVDTLFYTYNFTDVLPKFLYYKFWLVDWLSMNEASGVPSLNSKNIANVQVSIPSKKEQERIAEALSDVDGLLRELDGVIAKKRAIKHGAMQELLTGKRRLEGFTGEWEHHSFKDFYKYAAEGGTPNTSIKAYYENGKVPFVKIEDTTKKYIYSSKSYITEEGLKHASAWMVPADSIIFTNGATIGNVSINKIPVSTKQGILGIIPSEIIDLEFMYYLLSHSEFQKEVEAREAKGTFATVILPRLNEIVSFIPKDKEEQKDIAEILSDMDEEIAALEAKRAKYEQVKQGMMQELLTGKIRLV